MDIHYGKLKLAVPDDWRDRSTLFFVAPAKAGMSAPMSTKRPEEYHASLQVTFDAAPDEVKSAQEMLTAVLSAFEAQRMQFETLEQFPLALGEVEGHCATLKIDLGATLARQYMAIALKDGLFIKATVTMPESGHGAKEKDEALALLSGVRFT